MDEYSKHAYIVQCKNIKTRNVLRCHGCVFSRRLNCAQLVVCRRVVGKLFHTHTRRPATAKLLSPTAIRVRDTSTWTDLSRCRINLRDCVVHSQVTKTTKVIHKSQFKNVNNYCSLTSIPCLESVERTLVKCTPALLQK